MKVGVMVWTFQQPLQRKEVSLVDLIKITSDLGLKAFETQDTVRSQGRLWSCGFDEFFPSVPSRHEIKRLSEVADSYGVALSAMDAMQTTFLSSNLDGNLGYIKKWLQLASTANAKVLKIGIGKKPRAMSADRAFQMAHDGLSRCVRLAEDCGVALATEMWPESFPSSDANAIITLAKLLGPRYFGHTLDNELLPPDWAPTAYRLLARHSNHVHASVYPESLLKAAWMDRKNFLSLTKKPFAQFSYEAFEDYIAILHSVGYRGYVNIEWRGPNNSLDECVRGLRDSSAMLETLIAS